MFIVGLNHRGAHWGPLSHLLLLVLLLVLLVRPGAAAAVGAANAGGVLTFAVQEEAPNGTKARGPFTLFHTYTRTSPALLLAQY